MLHLYFHDFVRALQHPVTVVPLPVLAEPADAQPQGQHDGIEPGRRGHGAPPSHRQKHPTGFGVLADDVAVQLQHGAGGGSDDDFRIVPAEGTALDERLRSGLGNLVVVSTHGASPYSLPKWQGQQG